MVDAFRSGGVPLFVAYYRRAFPRFRKVAALLTEGAVGPITSVHIVHYDRLVSAGEGGWRVVPAEAGAGLLFDLASHGLDLLDFLVGPVVSAAGHATNTGGRYAAEDVTAASFAFASGAVGTGVWNFNADRRHDELIVTGRDATLRVPVFTDGDITVVQDGREQVFPFRNPPHVHQPLVQTIVDELRGEGRCPSTGESGARTSWVLDRLVESYYAARPGLRGGPSQASRSTSGLGRPDSA
jgi:predicted dehydrogenase